MEGVAVVVDAVRWDDCCVCASSAGKGMLSSPSPPPSASDMLIGGVVYWKGGVRQRRSKKRSRCGRESRREVEKEGGLLIGMSSHRDRSPPVFEDVRIVVQTI